jgi:hypothetical protein
MASLAEIRAKLLEKNKGGSGNNQRSGGDRASYPFWNAAVNTTATLRFLPDADPDNTFFWVKRETIRLPFEGVVGGEYPTNKPVTVTVPCNEMFGGTCPINTAIRPWWKGTDEDKLRARQYWKKKSYLFQGFVTSSPFEEQDAPENPIRRFIINQSIYDVIEKSITDPDMEDNPTDYVGGTDFRIAKTQKGEWANYSSSSWARKSRSLTEAEMAAVEKYGLHDLKQFLGRKPDADELEAIKTMFECSVAGEPYDMEAFGKYFKPYGSRDDDAGGSSAAPARTAAPVSRAPAREVAESSGDRFSGSIEVSDAPAAPASETKSNPSDILERIRLRTQK